MKPLFCIFLSLSLASLIGCSRKVGNGDHSFLQIQTPRNFLKQQVYAKNKGVDAFAAPDVLANRKECWAINITGENIPTTNAFCGPSIGKKVGFVDGGARIEMTVSKGTNRKIELFLYLAPEGDDVCPNWDDSFNNNGEVFYSRSYKVGEKTGVDFNSDIVTVSITANFPDIATTVAAATGSSSCQPPVGTLQSTLLSSGDVLDGSGTVFNSAQSHPTNSAVINTSNSKPSFTGKATNSFLIKFNGKEVQAPPFLASVTRKPDGSGEFFGLLHNGEIVKIDGNSGAISNLQNSCPFHTCKVPRWMESISAGFGKNLYAKDHSGQIYLLSAGGALTDLNVKLPAYFSHFSFY